MNITEKIPVIIFEDNAHLRDSLYFLVNSSHDFTCLQAFSRHAQRAAKRGKV